MKPIYQNFDTLEISFQCAIPLRHLSVLEQAKKEAQASRNPVYAEIGPHTLPVMVQETGAKGGYTYQFSTGPDGEIWLIGDRDNADFWNVRVRVRSLCLALYGYEKTKAKILKILLNDLHAKGPEDNDGIPRERISRFDYCLDFIIQDEFKPSYLNFVCAGRTKKGEFSYIACNLSAAGQFVETLTIGKMPNRQVTIYNKTKEITARSKKYWFQIWGIKESETEKEIWRVEIRAGKKELNKWNLRTFDDFEEMAGDVVLDILKNYRYCDPNINDRNQTRWPMAPIWKSSIQAVGDGLFEYISKAKKGAVLKEMREIAIQRYEKLISGIFIGYTAATGKDISEIPGVLDHVCGQILDNMAENPQKFIQKYKLKAEKFSFYDDNESPKSI